MQIWKTQYLPEMFTYRRNSRVLYEIGVGKHDGDVRFLTGSRNKAVFRMRNEIYAIWPTFMAESPKFLPLIRNRVYFTNLSTNIDQQACKNCLNEGAYDWAQLYYCAQNDTENKANKNWWTVPSVTPYNYLQITLNEWRSPVRTVNLVSRIRVLPLAKNICVWWRVAYGITVRDE